MKTDVLPTLVAVSTMLIGKILSVGNKFMGRLSIRLLLLGGKKVVVRESFGTMTRRGRDSETLSC